MAVTADHVRSTLDAYLDAHPEDKGQLAPLVELLDEVPDVTSRSEFRGHVTAGAVLMNAEGRVLHIHHNALEKWLLPGGHVEAEDVTLSGAALRELVEETGLDGGAVALAHPAPVHIDLHPIPANDAKGEPAHFHVDVRFLFRLERAADVELQEEEVSGYAWRAAAQIADSTLRDRVLRSLTAA
ncbi:putative DHNTP pyrophosphohydrolase [Streptomyces sp. 111WW2]|uniref:NUDIX hydrolase n=1 Tax=Streptomyces sp. 111WW2 TaxID=1945515 RepID=UPI000D0C8423|nr:NUDIX domain-containing protein [Streptomyces sp. 111WW2]PSK58017.1 putative DHNTP pyrophosphohydrolase [Streptomyces sp. 111WW2]